MHNYVEFRYAESIWHVDDYVINQSQSNTSNCWERIILHFLNEWAMAHHHNMFGDTLCDTLSYPPKHYLRVTLCTLLGKLFMKHLN